MAKTQRAVPAIEAETQPHGNQQVRFKALSDDEALQLLVEAPTPGVPDHDFDSAEPNSKLVVMNNYGKGGRLAVINMPSGIIPLPKEDIATQLPEGTKIYMIADGRFECRLPAPYDDVNKGIVVGARAADVIVRALKQARGELVDG